MSNVTLKNTKQEILDALDATEKKLKALESGKCDPVAEAKVATVKKAVESAEDSVKNNIFSAELIQKYNDLTTAIAAKNAELTELYGVEKELQKLTVVINAYKDKQVSIENDTQEQLDEMDTRLKEVQAMVSGSVKALYADLEETKLKVTAEKKELYAQLKVEREREQEQYTYDLKRLREKDNDLYEDMKAQREAGIAAAEAKVDAAWDEVNAKLEHITELEAKVAEIPTLIEDAKVAGAAEKEKELNKEYGWKKSVAEKDHAYEVSRLSDKLELLEKENDKKDAIIEDLQTKLNDAYAQVREIATKTVEASGGVKILGSTTNGQSK